MFYYKYNYKKYKGKSVINFIPATSCNHTIIVSIIVYYCITVTQPLYNNIVINYLYNDCLTVVQFYLRSI